MVQRIFERGQFDRYRVSDNVLNEAIQETRVFAQGGIISSKTTVFLSHKHSDLVDLRDLIGFLQKEYKVQVYIDSMDPNMPTYTCGQTALRIKDIINRSDRFILLATNDAIESKWCNWELGYGDAKKFKDKIAIFPLKDKNTSDSNYKGSEYMQIYPSIAYYGTNQYYSDGTLITPGYYVVTKKEDGNNSILSLHRWLRK